MKNNMSCQELEKEYKRVLEMLKNSFILYTHEINSYKKEKEKRNASIVAYKKRVSQQLKELQKKIESYEKIINKYKKENLELKKENILLKKKFKKTASSFTRKKEDNLIYKYFKDDIEIENFLEYAVNKTLKNELNPKEITPLYFRKELDNVLKTYLIQELTKRIKIEKIAILLASVLLNKFHHKIYLFIVSFLIDRIEDERYSNFIKILLTQTLIDKDQKYEPIHIKCSVDDMKMIYNKYKKISFKKEDLFTKIDLEQLDKDIENYLEEVKRNEEELENLTNKENDILIKITKLEEDEKVNEKKELEKIDVQKRRIRDNITKLKTEIEKLENKKLFLEPVNEVTFDNSLEKQEKIIVEKYNDLLNEFVGSLEKGLK